MKIIFAIIYSVLVATSANASSCLEKINDPNWTENKHLLVLRCDKIESTVGKNEYDQICFSITKPQYGDYKDTMFQTVLFNSATQGSLKTLVTMYENGSVPDGDQVVKNGSLLEVSQEKFSFEFGYKWIEKTTVDLKDTKTLKFDVFRKKFLRKKLIESTLYSCQKIQ